MKIRNSCYAKHKIYFAFEGQNYKFYSGEKLPNLAKVDPKNLLVYKFAFVK